jgi:hypothetical protein
LCCHRRMPYPRTGRCGGMRLARAVLSEADVHVAAVKAHETSGEWTAPCHTWPFRWPFRCVCARAWSHARARVWRACARAHVVCAGVRMAMRVFSPCKEPPGQTTAAPSYEIIGPPVVVIEYPAYL